MGLARLAAMACAGLVCVSLPGTLRAETGADAASAPPLVGPEAARVHRQALCGRLSAMAFPVTAAERMSALERLETVREACNDHPAFLALLGGLWLEQGDAARALLWLERSLMLDPEQHAAQADHALALASLGDFTARDELVSRWRDRKDVPPLVWVRLLNTVPKPAVPSSTSPWIRLREITLLYGYESNLDHSPRLDELTITPPDGPTDLPLAEPLRPRPGSAGLLDASWQTAYNPGGGFRVQGGLQGTARVSPDQSGTDWHSLQLVLSASKRVGEMRAQLQWGLTGFGGQLNEAYRLARWSLSLESNGLGCAQRLALDQEARRQRSTTLHDSDSTGAMLGVQCPLPLAQEWTASLALRAVLDRPRDADRPGGEQRQLGLGLRVSGPLGAGWRGEVSLRASRSLDEVGFSDLLANNERRWMRLDQMHIELSRRLHPAEERATDLVMQLHVIRQRSNIPIFEYRSHGAFGGLRWRW